MLDSPTLTIALLWLPFAGSHLALSSRLLRSRLRTALGPEGFMAVYSLVAFATFIPLVVYYAAHRHQGPPLWSVVGDLPFRVLAFALNILAMVLLVSGVLARGPLGIGGRTPDRVSGVHALTRHPVMMGLAGWALAHLLMNGHAGDVAFYGGFLLFVLIGCHHQDRRALAGDDAEIRAYVAATSFLPLTGRDTWHGLRTLRVGDVVSGVALAIVLRLLHAPVFH